MQLAQPISSVNIRQITGDLKIENIMAELEPSSNLQTLPWLSVFVKLLRTHWPKSTWWRFSEREIVGH